MNRINHNAKPFTQKEYRRLLRLTAERYACLGFEILESTFPSPHRFAIIRHDIDMSPTQALAIAQIEADLGVRATYTILLTGEFYSPFEHSTRVLLQQIGELGHDLGLHFDASWHRIEDEASLKEAITWETGILNGLLKLPDEKQVKMFSFHNTTPFTMACKASHYAGLRNAYAGYLQKNVQYISDSNGYWIHRSWEDLLEKEPDRIQILTHPDWWTDNDSQPAEKVCYQLANRKRLTWLGYRTLLEDGNRENRTGLSSAPSVLTKLFPRDGDRLLMLWLEGCRSEAFIELFSRFEQQCRRILRKYFRTILKTNASPVQALLSDYRLQLDTLLALSIISGKSVAALLGYPLKTYRKVKNHRNALIHGYGGVSPTELTGSFNLLIQAVARFAEEGSKLVDTTGTRKLSTKGMPRTVDTTRTMLRWLEKYHERLGLSIKAIHQFGQRHRLKTTEGNDL